jgi:hypothetical protein
MEFHGNFNGIPLNFMEIHDFPWNSMEKYNEKKIRQMFRKNLMENSMN